MERNWAAAIHRGIDFIGDLSGMECPRWALLDGIQGYLSSSGTSLPDEHQTLKVIRSSDCGSLQISVLKQISAQFDGGASCVFGAIEKRLPEVAQQYIIAATLDAKAS